MRVSRRAMRDAFHRDCGAELVQLAERLVRHELDYADYQHECTRLWEVYRKPPRPDRQQQYADLCRMLISACREALDALGEMPDDC